MAFNPFANTTSATASYNQPLVNNGNNLATWDQFRNSMVDYHNALGASNGATPLTYQPGNYAGMPQAPQTNAGSANGGAPSMPSDPRTTQGGSSQPAPASGGFGGYGTSSNPYLGGQATAIGNQQQQFLDHNLQGINSNAVAVGGVGGSREGVAQGQAIGLASHGLTDSLANLYGSDWNQSQNRGLSQYGMDQNFYTQQRGLDQSGAQLGANLWNIGNAGAWGPLNQSSGVYSPYTGFGQTTQTGQTGGGVAGAIGGALGVGNLGNNMGWWGK